MVYDVFIDDEVDIRILNSFKNNNFHAIEESVDLIKNPDFIYLLETISQKLSSDFINQNNFENNHNLKKNNRITFFSKMP